MCLVINQWKRGGHGELEGGLAWLLRKLRKAGHLRGGCSKGFIGVQGGQQFMVHLAGSLNVAFTLLQVCGNKVQQQATWQDLQQPGPWSSEPG